MKYNPNGCNKVKIFITLDHIAQKTSYYKEVITQNEYTCKYHILSYPVYIIDKFEYI